MVIDGEDCSESSTQEILVTQQAWASGQCVPLSTHLLTTCLPSSRIRSSDRQVKPSNSKPFRIQRWPMTKWVSKESEKKTPQKVKQKRTGPSTCDISTAKPGHDTRLQSPEMPQTWQWCSPSWHHKALDVDHPCTDEGVHFGLSSVWDMSDNSANMCPSLVLSVVICLKT